MGSQSKQIESDEDATTQLPTLLNAREEGARANFLPYPSSSMGPAIVPNDLTNFRSRGASQTEKRLEQELVELHEKYVETVDRFNWNRLVYNAKFSFEPVMGATYHLYQDEDGQTLSMVGPEEWDREFLGSFRLNIDRCWEPLTVAENFDRRRLFNS